MRLQPEHASGDGWIDTNPIPPTGLIATTVPFAMVPATEWDCELVANLTVRVSVIAQSACDAHRRDVDRIRGRVAWQLI